MTAAGSTTYATPAVTTGAGKAQYSFFTMPPPSAAGAPSAGYPFNWGLMADVGQTYNSSLTAQYLTVYANSTLAATGGLHMILNVADLT